MADAKKIWKTAITKIQPNEIRLRGYRIDELLGRLSFPGGFFLLFHSRLPTPAEEKLYDALLLSGIDHGVTPPSANAARLAASTGAPLNAALAAGVLSINKYHGAAIEPAMRLFHQVYADFEKSGQQMEQFVASYVEKAVSQKKRLFGYGHRYHKNDPRTARLFALAEEAGKAGKYLKLARLMGEKLSAATGKELPLNVDGAIAAILCELDFPVEIGNIFFILPRVAGMTAHYLEETTRERPMRHINPDEAEYDGPEDRPLPQERE